MNGTELLYDVHEDLEAATLAALYRTELAAGGTYREAARTVEREAERPALALHRIGRSHGLLAEELRDVLRQRGRPVPLASGPGGIWAAPHGKISSVAPGGVEMVLEALQDGERLSLGVALAATAELAEAMTAYVRYRLAPALEENLERLSELRAREARLRSGRRLGRVRPPGPPLSRSEATGVDEGAGREGIG